MDYRDFFHLASGHYPLPFQAAIEGIAANHVVLSVPTGLGKTDAVVVPFLYRVASRAAQTPRRLAYVLPGRALTEQVSAVVEEHLKRLKVGGIDLPVRVLRLLGSSADNDLTLGPEEHAVLVGTQDLLLSRALNRGYARKPFRWPIDFALLNNDCQWVFDEVQLLGDGLATSTQLAAFRDRFGHFGPTPVCWLSATLDPDWLETADFASNVCGVATIALDENDSEHEIVRRRLSAKKSVQRAPTECRLPQGVAQFVAERHQPGKLSLVIANTVRRATEIREAIEGRSPAQVLLLHSRFRAYEREEHVRQLAEPLPEAGRIVIATQVIEAGIDIDAAFMVTDVAPYSSLVQRFGRVNRYGEQSGEVYWVDRPLVERQEKFKDGEVTEKEEEQVLRPYRRQEIVDAAALLEGLNGDASPANLPKIKAIPPWQYVLRRADLLDLFDTTPDLGGNEIDVSRFVRSGEDTDVYFAWREWIGGDEGKAPPIHLGELEDGELCPAPLGEARKLKGKTIWRWNSTTSKWARSEADSIFPGMTLLMHVAEGCYSAELGWSPESEGTVISLEKARAMEIEGNDDDRLSFAGYRQTLVDHTDDVLREMRAMFDSLRGAEIGQYRNELEQASRYHDWGKAHPVMQETLHKEGDPDEAILAKQRRCESRGKHSRRYFRHELASALAMLQRGEGDLAAYVAAAHHGRIRMSIRSMPGEERQFVRGIGNGERLLPCELDGERLEETPIDLGPMRLGRGDNERISWTDRALRLRDQLGPFRLAFLEMLLRIADERASAKAAAQFAGAEK